MYIYIYTSIYIFIVCMWPSAIKYETKNRDALWEGCQRPESSIRLKCRFVRSCQAVFKRTLDQTSSSITGNAKVSLNTAVQFTFWRNLRENMACQCQKNHTCLKHIRFSWPSLRACNKQIWSLLVTAPWAADNSDYTVCATKKTAGSQETSKRKPS